MTVCPHVGLCLSRRDCCKPPRHCPLCLGHLLQDRSNLATIFVSPEAHAQLLRSCSATAQFVLDLLRERPIYAEDKITGKQHFVSPPELANRIMVARKALAGGMSKFDFPMYISRTNTEVLRQHLESNSYTSGSYEKVERRRQRRA